MSRRLLIVWLIALAAFTAAQLLPFGLRLVACFVIGFAAPRAYHAWNRRAARKVSK